MLLLLISQHVTHHVEWSDSARHEEPGTKSGTKLHREVTKYGDEKREGKEGNGREQIVSQDLYPCKGLRNIYSHSHSHCVKGRGRGSV